MSSSPSRVRMIACVPNPNDATSFYRAMGVFPDLRKKLPGLDLTVNPEDFEWSTLANHDLVFMQRPYTDNHLAIAREVKKLGIPLWIDYDDDLCSVPSSNPTYSIFMNARTKANLQALSHYADQITVSTESLVDVYSGALVIPNAFNFTPKGTPGSLQRRKVIQWRGSMTHHKDLAVFAAGIERVAEKNPDWSWHFLGDPNWEVVERLPSQSVKVLPTMKLMDYWGELSLAQALIHIVPLEDNRFNRSKSHCSWIEGTYSGAACLVPDWDEWRKPGVFTYRTRDEFETVLGDMILSQEKLSECVQRSWEFIDSFYLLSSVNELRAQVILNLVEKNGSP